MNFISTDLVKTLYFVKSEIKLSKKLSPDWEYEAMCYIGTAGLSINPWSQNVQKQLNIEHNSSPLSPLNK